MKILDRYLVRSLFTPLVATIVAFLAVAIIVNLFEELDTFIDNQVPAATVVKYYAAVIPGFFTIVLPIAALIAVLFCLGGMARRSELIAMTASGVDLYRVLRPILAAGLALSLVSLFFTLDITPRSEFTVSQIKDHEIKDRPVQSGASRRDLNYLGTGGRFYLIRRFEGDRGEMTDVVVQQFADGTLVHRIDASKATWEDDHWVFRYGYIRHFPTHGTVEAEHFDERVFSEIAERPRDFLRIVKEPDEMTTLELRDQIRRTELSGGDGTRLEVEWHRRLSFPFSSFIVILLGAPLTGAVRRGGHALGFGLALLIGFVYYVLLEVGRTFGTNGTLPTPLAAWLPNLAFLAAGLIGLWKTRK
jgi:lipopolysaccharide export system permease protein